MLVLTRRVNEELVIVTPDGVELGITIVGGGKVQLGIDAPANYQIHRREYLEQMRRERRAEANVAGLTER